MNAIDAPVVLWQADARNVVCRPGATTTTFSSLHKECDFVVVDQGNKVVNAGFHGKGRVAKRVPRIYNRTQRPSEHEHQEHDQDTWLNIDPEAGAAVLVALTYHAVAGKPWLQQSYSTPVSDPHSESLRHGLPPSETRSRCL